MKRFYVSLDKTEKMMKSEDMMGIIDERKTHEYETILIDRCNNSLLNILTSFQTHESIRDFSQRRDIDESV